MSGVALAAGAWGTVGAPLSLVLAQALPPTAAAPPPATAAPPPATAAPPPATAAPPPATAAPPPATAAPPAPSGPPAAVPELSSPPASGFQAAFRSGVVLPFGDATGAANDSLGRRYAWQVPLVVDLGARFAERYFAGAYFGVAFGSTGSDAKLEAACTDDDDDGENDIVCSVVSLRAGLEASYSFAPGARLNPWLGYGIGYEATTASYSDHERGYGETVTSGGVTWAQLSGGFDLRRNVGFGPLLEIALGRFTKTTTEIGDETFRVPIRDKAFHAFVMLGVRLVVNP